MKINEEVYLLDVIPGNVLGKDKIYPVMLKDNESLIMIDTGFPGLIDNIYKAIKDNDLDIAKLDKIILTHHDIDHIGTAKLLKENLENKVKVLSYEDEVEYIDGTKKPLKLKQLQEKLKFLQEGAKKICESMEIGFKISKLNVDATLSDGEVIPICGGVTVIHSPGHTLGHICLYLNKYKILITGDTLILNDGKLELTNDLFNYDSEENKRSVKKLLNYDIEKVICYHGGIFEGNVKNEIKNLLK